MAMVTHMPGHWPSTDEAEMDQGLHFPGSTSLLQETLQQLESIDVSSLSQTSRHQLLSDAPSSASTPAVELESEASSSSYLVLKPVVSSVMNIQEIDWTIFDPPRELLYSQADTPAELRNLLKPSIEQLQIEHQEEEERHAAIARRQRPPMRVSEASVKPRREVCEV